MHLHIQQEKRSNIGTFQFHFRFGNKQVVLLTLLMILSSVGLLRSYYSFLYYKLFLPLNALCNPINGSLSNKVFC